MSYSCTALVALPGFKRKEHILYHFSFVVKMSEIRKTELVYEFILSLWDETIDEEI